jgi:hypothetical protein
MADKTTQKTEFFRVAVEGQTATDGREITRQMIEECVVTFNRDTYGVRINMEHLRGRDPDGPFGSYGDVLALRHQEDELQIGDKQEKRLALYAQLDPTPELVEINRKRQKIYTSIEPQPNFGGTGKFGLVGLAVTDSPASLGTNILKFSTRTDDPAAVEIKADLDRRKHSRDSFFSSAYETKFELLADQSGGGNDSAFEKIAAAFARALAPKDPPQAPPAPAAPAASAGDQQTVLLSAMTEFSTSIAQALKTSAQASEERFARIEGDFNALKTTLATTPEQNHSSRPPATGSDGSIQTDF